MWSVPQVFRKTLSHSPMQVVTNVRTLIYQIASDLLKMKGRTKKTRTVAKTAYFLDQPWTQNCPSIHITPLVYLGQWEATSIFEHINKFTGEVHISWLKLKKYVLFWVVNKPVLSGRFYKLEHVNLCACFCPKLFSFHCPVHFCLAR